MEQLPLKDIHLPEPVSWWPPAPGWIMLFVLLPLLFLTGFYIYQSLKRKTAVKTARKLLDAIRKENHHNPLTTLIALSALLRRVAISTASRTDVASLNGQAWLAFLDTSFKDQPFSKGVGRCLADAQYRPALPDDTDMEELFKLCERWLKQQKSPVSAFSLRNLVKPKERK